MGDLMNALGKADKAPADRRARLVEATRYLLAVESLGKTGHLEGEDLNALTGDAEEELATAIASCLAAARSPAEVRAPNAA